MSWKGFTKVVDRASTTLMQKAGAVEKTIDKEYEDEERRFRNLEQKVLKLQKEAKGYLDSVRAMTIAQQRIADTINQFYDENAKLASLGMAYKDAARSLDEEIRGELDKEYRENVLDPLNEYAGYFPEFNEAIKKRQKKLLDYDGQRSRVRKLAEKPSDDVDKLPKVRISVLIILILFLERKAFTGS
jgi:amphiphysin